MLIRPIAKIRDGETVSGLAVRSCLNFRSCSATDVELFRPRDE